MERDHYIEWIMVDYGDKQIIKYFSPGDVASMIVNYKFGMKVYSYCNKHGLWVSEEI
jgi:superoxide reductase